MGNKNLTCLIFSCDKFSDLWDGNVKLFNKNWPNREFETFIVTDKPTDRVFDNVKVISAGENVEWSDRLKYALSLIKTDYIFITLDDYFLIKPVNMDHIDAMIDMMDGMHLDFIKIFKNAPSSIKEELPDHKGFYHLDTNIEYSVCLYPGIWKKEFLSSCIKEPLSAWHFEVSLSKCALEYKAKCLVCLNKEYEFLDVVRKGKLLRNAAKYFKFHEGIYEGNREVNSIWFEWKNAVQTVVRKCIPNFLVPPLMKLLSKFGFKFYSIGTTKAHKKNS